MLTKKLYYEDSHLKTFSATVLSCEAGKHGYDVVLDQTAFYPEGGGQPGDRGTLGGVTVTDTHEQSGKIVHYCDGPLAVGARVEGSIDWDWRFDLMQHHSGEHILSGLIHDRFGYDNVGFHMGRDVITIDLSGPIAEEELPRLERAVNEIIWQDLPVCCFWPDEETLRSLPYRSKKALTGAVRLVEFPGTDLCACCGTHVKRTGEIGLLKILSCVRFHEGVRMELVAGRRAVAYLTGVWEQNRQVSALLSARSMQTAEAVQKLSRDYGDAKYRLTREEDRRFAALAEAWRDAGDVLLFEPDCKPDALRRLADAVMRVCRGRVAVFSETDGGFSYAMGWLDGDIRPLTKELNTALRGRGGGKSGFTQGSVQAERAEIEAFFRDHRSGKEG